MRWLQLRVPKQCPCLWANSLKSSYELWMLKSHSDEFKGYCKTALKELGDLIIVFKANKTCGRQ